ncbi:P-loop containing nucleoside triphosphate hydrolase protein [Jimgerdemannia flammicorona]|uniref:RNA helicase n=1 Tax=Jimgerdemannia flammicorona TaxID=994334 RepID=A0A433PPS1_9FUNG|nr:P-loop containing nucleoside triphosphate hydrolase protein [Jimgerdemannia flammicorona]
MQGQDVVGAAETGSGKTLAFGIPIIQYLANRAAENSKEDNIKDGALTALILAPTRELAIQAMTIVGGMSVQKQHRLLENNPDIIVATPGRLWEVFSENEKYLKRLQNVKFLVLDEADRMLEAGHYRELNHILSVLSRHRQNTSDWPDAKEEESSSGQPLATLGKDLRFDLKKKKHKKVDPKLETGTMADLMERLDFTDASPAIVDMTTSGVVASTLVEAKVDCLKEEKDVFMYYFVTRYPGRTLVFVNSIDALRRLTPMFKLLGVEVLGLHAQMQQRQRLKNLDRFKQNDKAVMVASDVAARGLDIQLVEHVIHYQLPRSGEIYVHRSGRTARARRDGISLMLCGADEIPTYKRLCQALKKPQGYPDFPVDHGIVNEMKKHVALAKKIDEEEHHLNKAYITSSFATHDDDWMRKMAEAMDIEFDDDLLNSDRTERSDGDGQDDKADIRAKIRGWRNQLREMLAKPLMPHGASAKYLTGGTMRDLVERLMDETSESLNSFRL